VKQTSKNEYGLGWISQKTKGTRLQLSLYTFFILCGAGIELSIAFFLKTFIDIATGDVDASLLRVGLLAGAVIAVGGIIYLLNSILSKWIYGKIERNLRTELMDVIFSRRMADISKQHTGELLTKLTVDIQAVSTCFTNIISNMVGGAASAIVATAALFFLNWKMAVIMLVLTPVLMLVMGILTPFIQKASTVDKENDEKNRSMMQENLSRIMLIKAYFMKGKTIEKVKDLYAHKMKSGIKLGVWEGLTMFSGMLVANAMFMVAIGVGAYFVLQGETTLGSLIAIVQLLNYIVNPVSRFSQTISQVSQAIASSGRIGAIYSLPADKEAVMTDSVDAVELVAENLSFSYNGDDNILMNINASFAKGHITGIAGKSGSGKSTLLKLLIGLYTPRQGTVVLNHAAGTLDEITPQVAYVPPVDYLFSGTVAENIIMSENEPRLEELKAASSRANILDFIQSLPDGFDTPIGESGGTVSSGQAQRLAIARAIYKKSPIIVFDEPTANLDADSIDVFQSAVRQLAKDKICIIVTHDISTITVCDKVYLLEEGCVREKGA
jgi:ABC-type bacteriocin/lantibiotic exporter with double-glycine peptidase domain